LYGSFSLKSLSISSSLVIWAKYQPGQRADPKIADEQVDP
jgi:hypothetical protein